jgi:HAE1 family hydrophobic/amphiphilic exporter-1/multidrug efflux pump
MELLLLGGTIFSLVLTLLLFLHCTLCGRELKKHYPEFEHIEEYEKKQKIR